MAKRRGHGEGSIYQRKDGRWVASITHEHKRRTYYGRTRKEAAEQLAQALHAQQRGLLTQGGHITLHSFLEKWIEDAYRREVGPATMRKAETMLRNHIYPKLGHIRLDKLNAHDLRVFYNGLLDEGRSAAYVRNMHWLLHKALDAAIDWDYLTRNVTERLKPPTVEKHVGYALTVAQARALLHAVKGSDLEALLVLALTTGLRQGELLALHWNDIDLAAGKVRTEHTIVYVRGQGKLRLKPKTEASKRTVTLSGPALNALSAWQARCNDQPVRTVIVFPSEEGGYMDRGNLWRRFKKVLKAAGLPDIRFHDLRHSAASLLAALGVEPKVIQNMLGHESSKITMDVYTHELPGAQEAAMRKLGEALEG